MKEIFIWLGIFCLPLVYMCVERFFTLVEKGFSESFVTNENKRYFNIWLTVTIIAVTLMLFFTIKTLDKLKNQCIIKLMYEGYEKLQKFVDMIGKAKNEFDALDVVAKIILAVEEDESLIDDATKYVNECFEHAAIDNTTYYA